MRVTEWQGDVVFLHEVVPGVADRSYGIQVAKLAGLPRAVVERARIILDELEASDRQAPVERLIDDLPLFAAASRAAAPAASAEPDAVRELLWRASTPTRCRRARRWTRSTGSSRRSPEGLGLVQTRWRDG